MPKTESALMWIERHARTTDVWGIVGSDLQHVTKFFEGILPRPMFNTINEGSYEVNGLAFVIRKPYKFKGQPNKLTALISNEPSILAAFPDVDPATLEMFKIQ